MGKREALELVLLGLLADGHVLIEDNPGLAKTLIARSFAAVTGLRFARVQFTPDLMPSDVTGSAVYDQRTGDLRFQPGPIFTHILLGDEINRAPPKTQAALLEAMQERQVTSEDGTGQLERPFLVLATQNPIEYEGTYPLPEAQLDRFLMRIGVGYPDRTAELELLARRLERRRDDVELNTIVDREELLAMQRAAERVHADEGILGYAVDLVTATRESPQVQVGASPRGTLALLKLSRARAALAGRDFVTPDDVKVSPCRRWRIGSRCAPSSGSSAYSPRTSCATASTGAQRRPCGCRDPSGVTPAGRVRGARSDGATGGARHGTPAARGRGDAVRAAGRRSHSPASRSRWRASCGSSATASSRESGCARCSPSITAVAARASTSTCQLPRGLTATRRRSGSGSRAASGVS